MWNVVLTAEEVRHHNEIKHGVKVLKVKNTVNEEYIGIATKIYPDQDFLTKNTADLKSMLESIPSELLWFDENVFEKDIKTVLNSVKTEPEPDNVKRYECEQCNFRGTSKKCLKAHITFVHNTKFYICPLCPLKT